jgi:hypothetical protein
LYSALPTKEGLWDRYYTGAPARQRRCVEGYQESLNRLAERYDINAKTVAKWKKRSFVHDVTMGPKEPHSTVLSKEQKAACVAFRRHTLLPLDDCLYALQAGIPELTRSSLHRFFQRHDISRLPEVEGDKPAKKKFAQYPIGYFHIDIAEVRTEEGKLYMFVAIDRTSKFAYAELHERATRRVAADFLRTLVAIVPYKIHTVLTDNGIHFVDSTPVPASVRKRGRRRTARDLSYACLRVGLRAGRHRTSPHQAQSPLDEWAGGTREPNAQGSNRETLLL